MNTLQRVLGYGLFGTFVFIIDRMTKIKALMSYQQRMIINQFVSFDLVLNRGISWGFFYSPHTLVFLLISFIIGMITMVIAYIGIRQFLVDRPAFGELLVVVGSVSNLIDRVYYHGVIDFIELSYSGYTWPLFNVADMCIVGGIFLMVWEHYTP